MIDNAQNKDYIRDSLKKYLINTLNTLSSISENTPKSRIRELMATATRVAQDFEHYHGSLAADSFACGNDGHTNSKMVLNIEEKVNNE